MRKIWINGDGIKIIALFILCLIFISIYLFTFMGTKPDYVIPRRFIKILAMILTSSAVAYSSIVFQTITNNRILTPSVMGFESIYVLIQSLIVWFYGTKSFSVLNREENFVISVVLMMAFSMVLYLLLFKREDNNIYFLILLGMICGTIFSSISTFVQMVIDPNEFAISQSRINTSFGKVNESLLVISIITLVFLYLITFRSFRYLDILLLGKDNAINLGVPYSKIVKKFLLIIAICVSVSTALVGPVMFLGVLITNLTYQIFKTYRHSILIPACTMVSIIAIVGSQFLVEHVFSFNTLISIIINFIGGIYFICLLLKETKNVRSKED